MLRYLLAELIKGEEAYLMENIGKNTAVYVISGGHSEGHTH
ncbi:MAG: hypothetical protein AB1632_09465 [Nitrospirota bacterium]